MMSHEQVGQRAQRPALFGTSHQLNQPRSQRRAKGAEDQIAGMRTDWRF